MVCLGVKPGATGSKAQMNPLSNGSTPPSMFVNSVDSSSFESVGHFSAPVKILTILAMLWPIVFRIHPPIIF